MNEPSIEKFEQKLDAAGFPVGLHHAYWFAGFNAMSYQIVQSSPIVLYAKTLGASATILGIIAGLMPLLVIFQIPAANYISRIGYKRFVYGGWGTRVLFVFGLALVPVASFLNRESQLALVLVLLFGFNLSRGISSCAWLPWITVLVPSALRGKYLVRDAATQNAASFLVFVAAAGLFFHETHPWQFSILFLFSALMGTASLIFLKRIPDVPITDAAGDSKTRVPWFAMFKFPPFKKLLYASVAWSIAYGGMTAFTVAFMKSKSNLNEGQILLVMSVAFLGGLNSLWLVGGRLDKMGSKPVLIAAMILWIIVVAGWTALAGGVLPVKMLFPLILQFLMGLLAATVTMSNNRLAMALSPAMGRNHFLALYSVVSYVALGLSPIFWGLLIDALGHRETYFAGLAWNHYTVFFAAVLLSFIITLFYVRRIEETEAASLDTLLREVLIESPQRFWLRFWPRN